MSKNGILAKKELKLLQKAANFLFTQPKDSFQLLNSFPEEKAENLDLEAQVRYWRMRAFFENMHQKLSRAELFYNKAVSISENISNPLELKTRILIDLAGVQINQRAWIKAEKTLQIAEQYRQRIGADIKLEARIACRLGYLNLHYMRFEKAAFYFHQCDKLLQDAQSNLSLEDIYFSALCSSGLADMYAKIGDGEKSLLALQRTLDIYESHGLRINLIWHYLQAGQSYMTLGVYDKAITFFKKAANQNSEGAAANRARGSACANLAMIFIKDKNIGAATKWLHQAELLIGAPEQAEDYTNLSKVELQRARISIHLKEFEDVERHLEKAEFYAEKGDSLQYLKSICHTKASFYAEKGDFEKAYEYRTRAAELEIEHTKQVKAKDIQELSIKYDAQKREQEAHLARLQLTRLHLKALRVQMNPHFIFNALNAIQSFINSDRTEDAAIWLARFSKLMRKALDLSDLEQIELEDEVAFLNQYLELNKKLRFRDTFTYAVIVEKSIQEIYPEIPAMVVQPFVENAIEHGMRPQKGGYLEVRFSYIDETSIRCTITDNGVGLYAKRTNSMKDIHRSKGVSITKERLKLLFAERGVQGAFVQIQDRHEMTDGIEHGVISEVILPIVK